MHRTQVLLSDDQNQRLREKTRREGKSLSEVLRQILDEYFANQDRKAQMEALKALKGLDQIREATAQNGIYTGDAVTEVREERERQMKEIWQQ